jgi:hypothetical protein
MNGFIQFQDDGISGDVWAQRLISHRHHGLKVQVITDYDVIGTGDGLTTFNGWNFHVDEGICITEIPDLNINKVIEEIESVDADVVFWNVSVFELISNSHTEGEGSFFDCIIKSKKQHWFVGFESFKYAPEEYALLKRLGVVRYEGYRLSLNSVDESYQSTEDSRSWVIAEGGCTVEVPLSHFMVPWRFPLKSTKE